MFLRPGLARARPAARASQIEPRPHDCGRLSRARLGAAQSIAISGPSPLSIEERDHTRIAHLSLQLQDELAALRWSRTAALDHRTTSLNLLRACPGAAGVTT